MYPASQLDAALGAPTRRALFSWRPSRPLVLALACVALMVALVAAERWQPLQTVTPAGTGTFQEISAAATAAGPGVAVVVQLVAAALIGMLVTAVQRELQRDRASTRSMEQAQTLLCVSGALMMIIIGNSLARAFGIAGAAAIIRFRTPVDDPRDATILFLLLALGMACGIGALSLAGTATVVLCTLLPALDRFSGATPRTATLECTAAGREFPVTEIRDVFARFRVAAEPRELAHGDTARMKYVVTLAPSLQLEDLTRALVDAAGLASVSWDVRKKS